jgi:hypothetical protein
MLEKCRHHVGPEVVAAQVTRQWSGKAPGSTPHINQKSVGGKSDRCEEVELHLANGVELSSHGLLHGHFVAVVPVHQLMYVIPVPSLQVWLLYSHAGKLHLAARGEWDHASR